MCTELDSKQKINEKTDVYSFGVVLLEVLTGRHPLDPTLPEGTHLVQWVNNHLASNGDPSKVLDSKLRKTTEPTTMHEILQTLAVSLLCVNTRAYERPTMKDALAMLNQIRYFVEPSRMEDSDVLKEFSIDQRECVASHVPYISCFNFSIC